MPYSYGVPKETVGWRGGRERN